MQSPAPRLRAPVDTEPGDRIELIAVIKTNGADRRPIPKARPDRIPQVVDVDGARAEPDVPAIEKQDSAKTAVQDGAELFAELQHARAAEWRAVFAERAHLVPAPATDARGAAQKKALRERHVRLRVAVGADVPHLQAAGEDKGAAAEGQVMPALRGHAGVLKRSRQDAACLFDVKGELITARGVKGVVRGRVLQVEAQRVQRPVLLAGDRVEAERDQVLDERRVV